MMNFGTKNKIAFWVAAAASLAAAIPTYDAHADTSATTAANTGAPHLIDNLIFTYWGVYSGPSISHPSEYTNDSGAQGAVTSASEVQYIDSTVSAGFKMSDSLNFLFNYRFLLRPVYWMDETAAPGAGPHYAYRNKDPWITIASPKLVHTSYGLNIYGDIRGYIPATSSANMMGAVRLTQITTYDVPKTRLTLGLYTFERANMLTDVGAAGGMENFFLDASPFASYQITPTLALTFWSDVIQATYATVGSASLPQGWANSTVDTSFGVGWDITPKINLNPQITVYPAAASLENTTIGAILSAKIL